MYSSHHCMYTSTDLSVNISHGISPIPAHRNIFQLMPQRRHLSTSKQSMHSSHKTPKQQSHKTPTCILHCSLCVDASNLYASVHFTTLFFLSSILPPILIDRTSNFHQAYLQFHLLRYSCVAHSPSHG